MLITHREKETILYPIQSSQQYKSLIQHSKYQKQCFTTGTSEEATLQKKTLKRMSKHLETKSIVSTDSDSEPAQKKKKTNISMPLLQDQQTQETKCLLSLCEEDSCQEQETQTETSLRHLINQQHKQQQGIKLKLLQLLTHMKRSQQQLQLQTGILE